MSGTQMMMPIVPTYICTTGGKYQVHSALHRCMGNTIINPLAGCIISIFTPIWYAEQRFWSMQVCNVSGMWGLQMCFLFLLWQELVLTWKSMSFQIETTNCFSNIYQFCTLSNNKASPIVHMHILCYSDASFTHTKQNTTPKFLNVYLDSMADIFHSTTRRFSQ